MDPSKGPICEECVSMMVERVHAPTRCQWFCANCGMHRWVPPDPDAAAPPPRRKRSTTRRKKD